MNPFGPRGAADFADALDGGTAAALPGLALAARLRTVGAGLDTVVVPRAEFRDALRLRLMAVATVQAAAPQAAPLTSAVSWRRRTGAVAAGAMASVVAVSGVAVAGSQSLPGDPFYGVKKTAEAFQLRTADGDVEKGTQHLEFAATRLREVRGLTLGRDAADAGPAVGPAASDAGITTRSATQPLAGGDALSADAVERVKQTLAEMDEETREGSALLNDAYRDARALEPLRVLSTFAERQTAGLAQLLPALPPRAQDRARISLALLTGVSETTDELLTIGTCGAGCDPTTAAPTLPGTPGATTPGGSPASEAPCECATPAPAPAPGPAAPATDEPTAEPTPEPTVQPTPAPGPTSPAPAPSPSPTSGGLPAPVPSLPAPVPSIPVPLPTLTLPPLAPAVSPVLPGTSGSTSTRSSSDSAPAPAPAPTPLPVLAPLPPRP